MGIKRSNPDRKLDLHGSLLIVLFYCTTYYVPIAFGSLSCFSLAAAFGERLIVVFIYIVPEGSFILLSGLEMDKTIDRPGIYCFQYTSIIATILSFLLGGCIAWR